MKQEFHEGLMWFSKGKELVHIGLTPDFFKKNEEIWHIMPAVKPIVKEKQTALSVICNDGLFGLPSPVSGKIHYFNQTATDTPDKLKPDHDIMIVNPGILVDDEKTVRSEFGESMPIVVANAVRGDGTVNRVINSVRAGDTVRWQNEVVIAGFGQQPVARPERPLDIAQEVHARSLINAVARGRIALGNWTDLRAALRGADESERFPIDSLAAGHVRYYIQLLTSFLENPR